MSLSDYNELSKPDFWSQILLLIHQGDRTPPKPIAGIEALPILQYLPCLMAPIADMIRQNAGAPPERWSQFIGYSRRDDIRKVGIPRVLDLLQQFASEGDLEYAYAATGIILELTIRELLRRGELPVLHSLEKPAEGSTLLNPAS